MMPLAKKYQEICSPLIHVLKAVTPSTGRDQETAKIINFDVWSRLPDLAHACVLHIGHLGLCQAFSHYTFYPNGELQWSKWAQPRGEKCQFLLN